MPISRRTLLRLAAAGLSSALAPLGCAAPLGQTRGARHRPTPEEPFTPTEAWYWVAIQDPYEADLARYRLNVGGIVERGLRLAVSDMRDDFETAEESITLACVGNQPNGPLVSSAWFRGVRMRDVIGRAGVSSRARGAVITGLDGFVAYQGIDDLLRSESLLAFDMAPSQDAYQPLPIEHGFPCRLLTPGLYGYMQPKWVDTITFVDHGAHRDVLENSFSYLDGRMQLASGFTVPSSETVRAGERRILGYAFGDGRAIAEVAVQIDDGEFEPAEIVWNDHTEPGSPYPPYLWTLWTHRWLATAGRHRLRCRARYVDGETQMDGRQFPYSGGSIATMNVNVVDARG